METLIKIALFFLFIFVLFNNVKADNPANEEGVPHDFDSGPEFNLFVDENQDTVQ